MQMHHSFDRMKLLAKKKKKIYIYISINGYYIKEEYVLFIIYFYCIKHNDRNILSNT